ncbi:MAG: penicillin-insensitive murein endopeptidase [Polyangiaceae bacterium]
MKRRPLDRSAGLGPTRFFLPLSLLGLLTALPACAAAPPPAPAPAPRALVAPPPPMPPAPLMAAPLPTTAPVPALPDPDEAEAQDEDPDAEGPDDEEAIDLPAPATTAKAAPSPLLQLSDSEIHARFKKDPASLGPLSVGKPNAGALVNGIMMPKDPTKWIVLEPGLAYGTQETVDAIAKSIERVHAAFPNTQPIPIGHISSKHGGYLPVHKSHQAGRDVDLGYYFTTPKTQFISGTKSNLDLARTLAFIKAMFAVSDIEMIFIDTSIQKLLVEYAVSHGEDADWLDRTFQVRQKPGFAPIRHVRGHKNHIHVRFASPQAVAMGRRISGMVAIHSAPPPGTKGAPSAPAAAPGEKLIAHKARSGDTMQILARRYGTTVEAIQRANGLKSVNLKAGHTYQIPVPLPAKPGSPLPAKSTAATAHKPSPGKPAAKPPAAKPAPPKSAKKGKTGG